jgi:hypothetical protein
MPLNRRRVAVVAGSSLAIISLVLLIDTWRETGNINYPWLLLLASGVGLAIVESRRA